MKKHYHYFIDVDDLVQEGIIGLIEAVDKFDAAFGYEFTTYCGKWVVGAIRKALSSNNTIRIPKDKFAKIIMIRKYEDHYPQLSYPDLAALICEKENITAEKVEEYIIYRNMFAGISSLNDAADDNNESEMIDELPIPEEISIEEHVERKIISET